MRLATVLTPMTDSHLQLATQCGVTDVVTRYPGADPGELIRVKRKIESFDLTLSVIEGYLPIERLKLGLDDGTDLNAMKDLLCRMGDEGIPILCYNFMSGTDWVRTKLAAPQRGGAKVTAFDVRDAEQAYRMGEVDPSRLGPSQLGPSQLGPSPGEPVNVHSLWTQLEHFLSELLPVAEKAGVTLAMHPDDPPLPNLLGRARIMHSVENFERLLSLAPSSRNKICFCQGTFAEMGVDIPSTIRRLGPHIAYVHFRDVEGTAESFSETFHDNGPTDMVAAMRAYREVGFEGPLRPDHVPQLVGEDDGEPGYTMQGRLFAFGYIRALIQATEHSPPCY